MASVAHRFWIALTLAGGVTLAGSATAQIKGIDITAPAGPGGGYDQLARATQQVLQSEGLATGVQVSNVPGAGGTIGLAQFVTGKKRGTNLMVAGLGMVGAILTNTSRRSRFSR
jgi:putative tricarboxylic transport membrane protein